MLKFPGTLNDRARGRVEADIDFLEDEPGIELGEPTYKRLRGSIWEIRTPTREGAIRALFGVDGNDAVLVHAVKKKKR